MSGRLVVRYEPQHAGRGVLEDLPINAQKQRSEASGTHVGVRTSPPTYRSFLLLSTLTSLLFAI